MQEHQDQLNILEVALGVELTDKNQPLHKYYVQTMGDRYL